MPLPPAETEAPRNPGAEGPLDLGPFDLIKPVGRGAMGEVWRAVHRAQGTEVAIKLLHSTAARDPWAVESFLNEVKAAATLAHPGIVMVLDHGKVPADSGLHRKGVFAEGTPFLAMELVSGRALGRFIGHLSWVQIRDVLLQLLDALAHSHARGVIHRDIKPGNVMLRLPGGGTPTPKLATGPLDALLTDFGLAQSLDRHTPGDALVAGTPAYMAPEQLEGRWRDQGPWTDLYAMGCLAWAMLCGDAPFGRDATYEESLRAHLHEKPPPFFPKMPVPPGLEGWLRQLLAKHPKDRFARAADAAWGLATLSASSVRVGGGDEPPTLSTIDLAAFQAGEPPAIDEEEPTDEAPTDLGAQRPVRPSVVVRGRQPVATRHRTPLPRAWQTPRPALRAPALLNCGLNLFGIRPPPMVDRTPERDTLWAALREVHEGGRARVVVLEGPAGCGRSRLGAWLCERADEVGAARVLRAVHSEEGGPGEGLGAMLARSLRCEGLDAEALQARLLTLFEGDHPLREEIPTLLRMLDPGKVGGFVYPRERYSLLRTFLEREADSAGSGDWEAVVILWIDDAHLGTDALEFVRFLLETQSADPLPVLAVVAVRQESLAERGYENSVVDRIRDHKASRVIPVGPLPEAEHIQLTSELLGLESELCEQIASRTAGNPALAVAMVGGFVATNALEAGPNGFRLHPGVAVELPAGLETVWADRAERILQGLRAEEAIALELAATLGAEVDAAEWQGVCAISAAEPSPRLRERLEAARLIAPKPGGFAFAHVLLHEALLARAARGGRSRAHHRAAVTFLERPGARPRGLAERLGRHLLLGGSTMPALGMLLEGARERLRSGQPAAARRLLAYRERALTALQIPPSDELWGLGQVLRLEVERDDGEISALEEQITWTEQAARRHGWTRVLAQVQGVHAELLRSRGRLSQALDQLVSARRLARECSDQRLEARILLEDARCRTHRGELALAAGRAREGREILERLGDELGVATAHLVLGRIALQEGLPTEARKELEDGRKGFLQLGARWAAAECASGLADAARVSGDLKGAEAQLREAQAEMEATAHPLTSLCRLNLAVLLVERKEYVEARGILEPTLRALTVEGRHLLCAAAHLVLLAPVAHHGEWGAWDHHLNTGGMILADTGFIERDNARMALMGAEEAIRQGEPERAAVAMRLCAQQLRALGDLLEAQSLEARADRVI